MPSAFFRWIGAPLSTSFRQACSSPRAAAQPKALEMKRLLTLTFVWVCDNRNIAVSVARLSMAISHGLFEPNE